MKLLMYKNKEEGLNYTHMYMNAAVNGMFTQITVSRGFKLFGERSVSEMAKEFRQLDEGAMPGKEVIESVNPYVM